MRPEISSVRCGRLTSLFRNNLWLTDLIILEKILNHRMINMQNRMVSNQMGKVISPVNQIAESIINIINTMSIVVDGNHIVVEIVKDDIIGIIDNLNMIIVQDDIITIIVEMPIEDGIADMINGVTNIRHKLVKIVAHFFTLSISSNSFIFLNLSIVNSYTLTQTLLNGQA